MALDENQYCNKCDYELEIEYHEEEVPGGILDLIVSLIHMDFIKKLKGKNKRFLEAIDEFMNLYVRVSTMDSTPYKNGSSVRWSRTRTAPSLKSMFLQNGQRIILINLLKGRHMIFDNLEDCSLKDIAE